MTEIIARHNIRVNQDASSWKESIRMAALPLLEAGSIEEAYIERMITSVEDLGPYIVLMPGLALAHAAPGADVKMSNLSIATFSHDILFHCENDPVRVVMCLACTDSSSHIERLQRISEKLLDEPDFMKQVLACNDEDALYDVINT